MFYNKIISITEFVADAALQTTLANNIYILLLYNKTSIKVLAMFHNLEIFFHHSIFTVSFHLIEDAVPGWKPRIHISNYLEYFCLARILGSTSVISQNIFVRLKFSDSHQ